MKWDALCRMVQRIWLFVSFTLKYERIIVVVIVDIECMRWEEQGTDRNTSGYANVYRVRITGARFSSHCIRFGFDSLRKSYFLVFHSISLLRSSHSVLYLFLISRNFRLKITRSPNGSVVAFVSVKFCHNSHGRKFSTTWRNAKWAHGTNTHKHPQCNWLRMGERIQLTYKVQCVNNELMLWIRVTTLPTGQKTHLFS